MLAHYDRLIALPTRDSKKQEETFEGLTEIISIILQLKRKVDNFNNRIESERSIIFKKGSLYGGEHAKINTRFPEPLNLMDENGFYHKIPFFYYNFLEKK